MANISKVNFNGNNLDVKDAYAREQILHKTADNYIADVAGDYTINAGDIAMSSANATMHTTADRTIDTDGNDSVHINGASTLNVGGLRTETFAGDKTEAVTGTATGTFSGDKTETVTGTATEKAGNRNTTVTGKWAVNLPGKAFDMRDVALESDIVSGYANVKDYGAVGDGATDDTEAIKRCLDVNRMAFFPTGVYLISETLAYDSVTLLGATTGNTIIKMNSTKPILKIGSVSVLERLTFTFVDDVTNCGAHKYVAVIMSNKWALQRTCIKNLIFDNVGTAFENDPDSEEVEFSIHFDSIQITNFGYCGFNEFKKGSSGNRYTNIYITSPKSTTAYGMLFTEWCNNHTFSNINIEHGTYERAFKINSASNIVIDSITFEGVTIQPLKRIISLGCCAEINNMTFLFCQVPSPNTNYLIELLENQSFGTRKDVLGTFSNEVNLVQINSLTVIGLNNENGGMKDKDIYIFGRDMPGKFYARVNNFIVQTYNDDLNYYYSKYAFLKNGDNIIFYSKMNTGLMGTLPDHNKAGMLDLYYDQSDSNALKINMPDGWYRLDYH